MGSPKTIAKNVQNYTDPAGSKFGLKTDTNERYNKELQFQLMHRTETQMNMYQAKAFLRNEDPIEDGNDYKPRKVQKIAQNTPVKAMKFHDTGPI